MTFFIPKGHVSFEGNVCLKLDVVKGKSNEYPGEVFEKRLSSVILGVENSNEDLAGELIGVYKMVTAKIEKIETLAIYGWLFLAPSGIELIF